MIDKLKLKSEFSYNVIALLNGLIAEVRCYPMSLYLQECFEYLGYKEGDLFIFEIVLQKIRILPIRSYLNNVKINYITRMV